MLEIFDTESEWLKCNMQHFEFYQIMKLSCDKVGLCIRLKQEDLTIKNSWHGTSLMELHQKAMEWLKSKIAIEPEIIDNSPKSANSANGPNGPEKKKREQQEKSTKEETKRQQKTQENTKLSFKHESWLELHLPLIETYSVFHDKNPCFEWYLGIDLKTKDNISFKKHFVGQTYEECQLQASTWLQNYISLHYPQKDADKLHVEEDQTK